MPDFRALKIPSTTSAELTVTSGEPPVRESRSAVGGFVSVEVGSIPAILFEGAGS